jgi:hypothetical protein
LISKPAVFQAQEKVELPPDTFWIPERWTNTTWRRRPPQRVFGKCDLACRKTWNERAFCPDDPAGGASRQNRS